MYVEEEQVRKRGQPPDQYFGPTVTCANNYELVMVAIFGFKAYYYLSRQRFKPVQRQGNRSRGK